MEWIIVGLAIVGCLYVAALTAGPAQTIGTSQHIIKR